MVTIFAIMAIWKTHDKNGMEYFQLWAFMLNFLSWISLIIINCTYSWTKAPRLVLLLILRYKFWHKFCFCQVDFQACIYTCFLEFTFLPLKLSAIRMISSAIYRWGHVPNVIYTSKGDTASVPLISGRLSPIRHLGRTNNPSLVNSEWFPFQNPTKYHWNLMIWIWMIMIWILQSVKKTYRKFHRFRNTCFWTWYKK